MKSREMKGTHPNDGNGLAWLRDEEHLLAMGTGAPRRARADAAAGDVSAA